jgi:hypothetical protein
MQLKELPSALPSGTRPAFVLEVSDQDNPTSRSIKYPNWQPEFEAALREGDPESLRQRVDAAEGALFLRSQALAGSAEGHAELQAISAAIRTLREIQREKLGYPELNKT